MKHISPYIKIRTILLVGLLVSFITTKAIEFQRVGENSGLTDNFVLSIMQDSKGFMWVGTMSGVFRYDGYLFTKIREQQTQKTLNNRIRAVREDFESNMWIFGYNGNVHFYDRNTNSITATYPDDLGKDIKPASNGCFYVLKEDKFIAFSKLGFLHIDKNRVSTFLQFKDITKDALTEVYFLIQTADERVWIGSSYGMWEYKVAEKTLVLAVPGKITHAIERDGHIYFFDDKAKKVNTWQLNTNAVKINTPMAFYNFSKLSRISKSEDGIIWFASDKGLIGLSKDEKSFIIPNTTHAHIGRVIREFIDHSNNIWFITTQGKGIYRYNILQQDLRLYPVSLTNSQLTSKDVLISYFYEDREKNMWIGTSADGLLLFDRNKDEFIVFQNSQFDSRTISSNSQLAITQDKAGYMWFGTRKGGICKLKLQQDIFKTIIPDPTVGDKLLNEVNSMMYTNDTYILSTISGELFQFNPESSTVRKLELVVKGSSNRNTKIWAMNMLVDSKQNCWIATKYKGLYKALLDKKGNRLLLTKVSSLENKELIENLDFYGLVEDNGIIWAGSHGFGLYNVDINAPNPTLNKVRVENKPSSFANLRSYRFVFKDSRNRIWAGGIEGLIVFKYDRERDKFTSYRHYTYIAGDRTTIPFHDINNVYETKDSTIWVASNGGGFASYNEETKTFESFSIEEGLSSSIIYGMIEDKSGALWLSTSHGLSKFERNTRKIKTYFKDSGLSTSTMSEFLPKSDREGRIFMGTTYGLLIFNPAKVIDHPVKANLLISGLSISNKSISDIQNININEVDKIKLKHNQKDISIEFSSDMFSEIAYRRYEYMLKGYDEKWNTAHLDNKATYTNLNPGNYEFMVRILGVDDNIRSLKIRIRQHPLKSPLAVIIYLVIFTIIVIIATRVTYRYYRMDSNLKMERKISNVKLMFFTNISHELRTLLTLIQAPLEALENEKNLNDRAMYLVSTIRKNTNILLHLVGDILDFRKIQSHKMNLKITHNEIVSFFRVITDLFELSIKAKGINFSVTYPDKEIYGWFDVEKMEKVLTNLLSNALKFTPKKGTITCELVVDPDKMILTVKDTGIGFDLSSKHLFERFFQFNDVYQHNGSGIGLSLIKEFVNLHKGNLEVDSKPGEGSSFVITIPITEKAYTENELKAETNWQLGSCAELIVGRIENETSRNLNNDNAQIKNELILVVEDNTELREFLVNSLSKFFMVESAEDGIEGYHKANSLNPDLIITDVVMPNLDGIEMVKKIRGKFEINHIPIVMLTAKSRIEDKIDGIIVGADDYIEKPFNLNYLLLRINNLISRRKLLKSRFTQNIDISKLQTDNTENDKFLNEVQEVIIKHLDESDFGVEELSKEMFYSKTQFFTKIKQLTGCSPNQYIKMIKLKKASEFLAQGKLTISEICYAVGYNDIDHFREQFKNMFDVTPSQFKKQYADSQQEKKENEL
jgi:signal transduction histidine kinase/ligand-binding sensor domain-containing protein/DNA-binding NarL/FixJ family response regulator